MAYQEEIQAKRLQTAQAQKEQQELAAMIGEMKKMQMASLMGSQGKSTVILTDQTDLGDKLKAMVDSFAEAVKSTDTAGLDKEQIASLKSLENKLETLTKAIHISTKDNRENKSDIIKALRALDLQPVVNVPAPNVTVKASDVAIDFSPIIDAIRLLAPEKDEDDNDEESEAAIDLSNYRAQDIKDSGDDLQYVGFMNPYGDWYIIENDVRNNSMRYLFGSGDYAEHWRNAATYRYRLLGEAVNDTV